MADVAFKKGQAPWEQGTPANVAFAKGAAPWEIGKQEKVVDQMHPDISFLDRLKVKALGNNVDTSMNFLKRQYPNLEFRNAGGDIQARTQGDAWKKLDPSRFDLQDITDLAYDVPAGIVQGAATALGGTAGLAAGGVGALPGAMVAGGASGAGLEAARQGLGKYFGVNDEVNTGDVALAGGTGAVSPLLFGTGAVVKNAGSAVTNLAKNGMTDEAKQLAQRGLLGRGWDSAAAYAGPKIGEMASNIPAPILKTAAKILPAIQAADKSPAPIVDVLQENSGKVVKGLNKLSSETGLKMNNALDQMGSAGGAIETENLLAPLRKAAAEARAKGTQADIDVADGIESAIKDNFAVKSTVKADLSNLPASERLAIKAGLAKAPEDKVVWTIPETLTPRQAKDKYFKLKSMADGEGVKFSKLGTAQGAVAGQNPVNSQMRGVLLDATQNAQEQIKGLADNMSANGTLHPDFGKEYRALHGEYANVMDQKSAFQKASSNETAFQGLLTKAQSDANAEKLVLDLANQTGVNLPQIGQEISAIRTFRKPSGNSLSLRGSTSTSNTLSKQIPLAMAGGAAGYYAGQQSGGEYSPFLLGSLGMALGGKLASPAGLRMYMQANQAARNAPLKSTLPLVGDAVNAYARPQMWLPQVLADQAQNPK